MKYPTKQLTGQSILEYCAIAMFIVMGILAMGPHVVRSVNAYFKSAEDQARDSIREDLRQARLVGDELNYDLGDCDCSPLGTPVCGDGESCALNEQMQSMTCTPASCLEKYEALGVPTLRCDAEQTPTTAFTDCFPDCTLFGLKDTCPKSETDLTTALATGNCGWKCCLEAEPVIPPQCGKTPATAGKALMKKRCGALLEEVYFWEPSSVCSGFCTSDKDPQSDWCDPVGYNYDISASTPTVHVPYEVDGADGCEDYALTWCAPGDTECYLEHYKCLARCWNDPHLIPNSGGCVCEPGWVWDDGLNRCVFLYCRDVTLRPIPGYTEGCCLCRKCRSGGAANAHYNGYCITETHIDDPAVDYFVIVASVSTRKQGFCGRFQWRFTAADFTAGPGELYLWYYYTGGDICAAERSWDMSWEPPGGVMLDNLDPDPNCPAYCFYNVKLYKVLK